VVTGVATRVATRVATIEVAGDLGVATEVATKGGLAAVATVRRDCDSDQVSRRYILSNTAARRENKTINKDRFRLFTINCQSFSP